MTQKNYNCTQQEVYTTALIILQSCSQHLAAFTAFSPMYTPEWVEEKKLFAMATSQLSDEQARGAEKEVFRVELEMQSKECLSMAQKLKRYITKAFEKPFQKTRLEEAGFDYYEKASNNNWEDCRALLSSAGNFIEKHAALLVANLNMPPAFENEFKNAKDLFFTKHQEFVDSEETFRINTEKKQVDTNQVYGTNISICLDGQEIFKDNDAIRKQFVFEDVLFLVSGTATAGFKGTVTDAVTGLPLQGVLFTLKGSSKTALTDEDGKYSIIQLAADTWNVEASKAGYQAQQFVQEVKTGTTSTVNVALLPV